MQLTLYIDTSSNQLLTALNNPTVLSGQQLPFFVGDTIQLQVFLLTPLLVQNPSQNNYEIIPTTGLQFELFFDNGEFETDVIYTQQVNWNTDPNNQYFYANLALNTVALETLLGAGTSAGCYLHCGYVTANGDTTVLLEPITVQAGIPNNVVQVPAGLTPLSLEAARQIFVQIAGVQGQGITIISPNGKKLQLTAVDNGDGTATPEWNPTN